MAIAYEQFEMAVCVESIWGETFGGEVSGSGLFLGGNCPEGSCPGGYCPCGAVVQGGTVLGELSGEEFTQNPKHLKTQKVMQQYNIGNHIECFTTFNKKSGQQLCSRP